MSSSLPAYREAAALVQEYTQSFACRAPRPVSVDLLAAADRILAEPVRADQDMPSFPRSTRDGFACRAAEASDGTWLRVAGSIRAGDPPGPPLPLGCAWEIMTGAAVPEGADGVAMLEHVDHEGERIRLAAGRRLDPGENVVPRGAEARSGEVLISGGTRFGPQHIAAAACCGYAQLEVFSRPRVAILTTGDELVEVSATPGPGQIRNSNAFMLAGLVTQAGGEAWILPTAKDNAAALESVLREGVKADLLLISGGVSAGKFDLVEPALAAFGARFHFTGVRIQPGKPLVFGELARDVGPLPFFGLPGNPISSAATFLLFAAPVLRALQGLSGCGPAFAAAVAGKDIKGKPNLTRFVPSRLQADPQGSRPPEVQPVNWQGSGDLAAFARANCFAVVPEGTDTIRAGELVHILAI